MDLVMDIHQNTVS